MISELSTYHDIRAIGIIRAFVAQTARFFGANDTEISQLELAAEKASSFIINALLPDADEAFKIVCQPFSHGLRFLFENRGLPVDEENLPVYDSKNPGDSMEGLPFFLIENVTDSVRFRNRGNEGWVLEFEKRLQTFRSLETANDIDPEILKACAKEKLVLDIAAPEDAYSLVKLTYFTYRYSYVKEIFYYRKALEEALQSRQIIAFVGKNPHGEVVINSAFFRSDACDAIAEAGMLMSRPEYRMNRALLRLTRMQYDFVTEGKEGLRVLYSKLVTSHTRSQRLLAAYRFTPTALKLSVHDQAEFVGLETDEEHRESLLYALTAPNGFAPATLFVPQNHLEITQTLLAPLKSITLSTQSRAPQTAQTAIDVKSDEEERYASVTIKTFGQDWAKTLRQTLHRLDTQGVITVHLHLPAHAPLPENLDEILFDLELLYSGAVIKTLEKWELVYTLLQGQRFDFEAMQLHEPNAKALRDYIQTQYRRLKEEM